MAKQNVLTRSKKIKAEELFHGNRLEEAKALYASVCQIDRTDADAWAMLGTLNRKLGLFPEAEECCRRALAIKPNLALAHHALGAALQCQGRMQEAMAAYQAAIRLKPDFAAAHYFLANLFKDLGAVNEAERHYREAIGLEPEYLEALGNLGALMMNQEKPGDALELLQKALKLSPKAPQVLCNIGSILEQEGRFDEAREKFRQALVYAPDFVDALAMLAGIEEKSSHLEVAKPLLEKGLRLAPDNVSLNVMAAKIARTEGRFNEAIELLEKVHGQNMMPLQAGDVCINLGKLYDRQGDAVRAFACFEEGNRLVRQTTLPADYDRGAYVRRIERSAGFLSDKLAISWQEKPRREVVQTPVFLLGFPRSGTTLLDQILDSHPHLQALSEKPTVSLMVQAFLENAGDNPDALADLTMDQIDQLRRVYFGAVASHVDLKPDSLLVDKMPLNTVNAHLIWRVFPEAKFILAIRHPCDVCLSCFMQNFSLNEAMSVFFTLEETASLYARVMGFWQKCVNTLPLHYHRIRYEDVVADFEGQTRALLGFLGVEWDDAVLRYNEHAKQRVINTPSYHQVTQPIYQHAKYRWKRYAKEFEPVIGTLQPFIEYFGYEKE